MEDQEFQDNQGMLQDNQEMEASIPGASLQDEANVTDEYLDSFAGIGQEELNKLLENELDPEQEVVQDEIVKHVEDEYEKGGSVVGAIQDGLQAAEESTVAPHEEAKINKDEINALTSDKDIMQPFNEQANQILENVYLEHPDPYSREFKDNLKESISKKLLEGVANTQKVLQDEFQNKNLMAEQERTTQQQQNMQMAKQNIEHMYNTKYKHIPREYVDNFLTDPNSFSLNEIMEFMAYKYDKDRDIAVAANSAREGENLLAEVSNYDYNVNDLFNL